MPSTEASNFLLVLVYVMGILPTLLEIFPILMRYSNNSRSSNSMDMVVVVSDEEVDDMVVEVASSIKGLLPY